MMPSFNASIETIPALKRNDPNLKIQLKHLAWMKRLLKIQTNGFDRHQQRLHELTPSLSPIEDGGAVEESHELKQKVRAALMQLIPKYCQIIDITKARIAKIEMDIKSSTERPLITVGSTLSPTKFDPVFLRDSCSCPRCIDPSTSQKLFETADIPPAICGVNVETDVDGTLYIKWANDIPGYEDHTSFYTANFLERYQDLPSRLSVSHNSMPRMLWDRDIMARNTLIVDYESYMTSASILHNVLIQLHRFGLVFVRSVPSEIESVGHIAQRIGPLRSTFYGSTWDVKSMPLAKNVANTSRHLGFHQDLLYMADPPGLQMLHIMKASSHGGESLFSDAFRTVERLRDHDATSIRALRNFDVTYQYKNDGQWYQHTRPTIEADESSLAWVTDVDKIMFGNNSPGFKKNIKAVNWSPPFQAPFMIDNGGDEFAHERRTNLRHYLEAARNFKRLAEEKNAVFETKIEEGTCVIFDNRRILHARKAFESQEGERWLRGAYVDTDPFKSRLRTLNEEYGVPKQAIRVPESDGWHCPENKTPYFEILRLLATKKNGILKS